MKHEQVDDRARVWILTRGPDGRLQEELDPQFLTAIGEAASAQQVADIIAVAAGEMEIAETRAW
jgi:hypothetical protein